MVRLEVRCCCNPDTVYGTVEVPLYIWTCKSVTLQLKDEAVYALTALASYKTVTLPVGIVFLNGRGELAVNSNHMTIEELRKIVSFKELGK